MGKEGRGEDGERLAPPEAVNATQGSTLLYNVKRCDEPVPFIPPHYAYGMEYIEDMIGRGGRIVSEQFGGSDYWWFEFGGTLDTISDTQEITLELRRLLMGVWNYIKNSGK